VAFDGRESVGRKGKELWIDNENEVSSCVAWGYLDSHGLRRERSAYYIYIFIDSLWA
jgi:hypothetical protein